MFKVPVSFGMTNNSSPIHQTIVTKILQLGNINIAEFDYFQRSKAQRCNLNQIDFCFNWIFK